jgi:hypothetical protein
MLNNLNSTANSDPTPKINQAGAVDIYGIGQNSGELFPVGTSTYGNSKDDGKGSDTNGPGHSVKGNTTLDTTSTDDYLAALAKLSQTNPDQYMQIQQGLFNSGFYGHTAKPADVGFGRWNAATKDALIGKDGALTNFIELYKSGATPGVTFNDWLDQQAAIAKNDPNSPGNGGGTARVGTSLTDPALITQQGNSVSDQMLGHSLDQSDQTGLINDVQGSEIASQDAQKTGADYTLKDPAAQARNFVVQNNLPEYAAHQAEGYMNVFANMFLNGASSRANTTIGDVAVGTK